MKITTLISIACLLAVLMHVDFMAHRSEAAEPVVSRSFAAPSGVAERPRQQLPTLFLGDLRGDDRPVRLSVIEIEGSAAAWNKYVDRDGIVVRVTPRDNYGQPVAVEGTLNVELIGTYWSKNRSELRRPTFPVLGRWSRRVRMADFSEDGAVLTLRYRSLHPQFDLRIAPEAIVTARLSVAGEGVFSATDPNVRLWQHSRMRDMLELQTKKRFFPSERIRRWRR